MNAETLKIMTKIVELNKELEELEVSLYMSLDTELFKKKHVNEEPVTISKIEVVNEPEPEETESTICDLKELGLSQTALDILEKEGIKYIYDVEEGIKLKWLAKVCGKDFKSYNEIVACFKDWGIPVEDDLNVAMEEKEETFFRDNEPDKKSKPIAEKYTKEPYTLTIDELKIDKRVRNTLMRCGYNTVYDVYITPKKALMQNRAQGHNGLGYKGYKVLYDYFKDTLKIRLKPVKKNIKLKDAKW